MNRYIEVCVREGVSTTDRGKILERFARSFLETQNYKVVEEVRITGMEVDLLAEEESTGERIIVECKAYRSTIAADILTKLYGNVCLQEFSAGWLISTHDLGKDAKGIRDKWSQKDPGERRKLQIYDPNSLIDRLIKSRFLFDPAELDRPRSAKFSDDLYLLLTNTVNVWAVIGVDDQTLMRRSVYAFDAHSGERITARPALASLASLDSSIASLVWEAEDNADRSRETQRLKQELQSVVRVQSGDNWADYRPSRPEDYVGREELQKDILDLFSKVRNRTTNTRVFAIKGPSGWGKSSSVLKIAERADTRNARMFVYAVDSRAASSRRFVELALFRAISEAIEQNFVKDPTNLTIGGPNSPFSTESIKKIFNQLNKEKKAICLIFDQFEELLYKEDMSPIFDDVRMLCDAAIEAGEGFLIGFSWKTDGAVPPEHNAYHLWHSLADRRREFELGLFSSGEVTVAINRFAKQIEQPLSPQLRRLLWDHCQGYPWLLKKLCIHILDQIRSGLDQSEILVRTLRIEELFSRDIEKLNQPELSCLKQIAQEAPAEFFKIVGIYGDSTITSLLDKRLIIRTGSRLNVYWDIFRDYILNDKVPYIPTTYIPQINSITYLAAVRNLIKTKQTTYQEIAESLQLTSGTADNLVRDMVIVGHAEANRKSGLVLSLHDDAQSAASSFIDFCKSHALYRNALEIHGVQDSFSLDDVVRIASVTYSRLNLSDNVLEQYANRIMQWCVTAGLIDKVRENYTASHSTSGVSGLTTGGTRNHRGRGIYTGESIPDALLTVMKDLFQNTRTRDEFLDIHGSKHLSSLSTLGITDNRGSLLIDTSQGVEVALRTAASSNQGLQFMRKLIESDPHRSGAQLGHEFSIMIEAKWSVDSCSRAGNALRGWVAWTWPNDFRWVGSTGPKRRLLPRGSALADDATGNLFSAD